jgi:hypothetical protein
MSPRTPIGHDLLDRLASLEAVDGLAKPLANAVRGLKAPAKVNEALSGLGASNVNCVDVRRSTAGARGSERIRSRRFT